MPAIVTRFFPLWALLLSAVALLAPRLFLPARDAIVPLLMLVMLGMGLTLEPRSLLLVFRRPRLLALGAVLQFTVMPLCALLVAKLLGLEAMQIAGMVLVGASSGGTASNVITYLAGGDVALSVALTAVSTLLAVVLMPGLTWLLIGHTVPVPTGAMLLTVAQVALGPVLVGMVLRQAFPRAIERLQSVLPLASVVAICIVIAVIVALNHASLATVGGLLALAVMLHNGIGLAAGYWLARLARADVVTARTLAIEVGMQNSGLAVALAVKYFGPAAAVPGALFSIWHNVSGSLLAGYWGRRSARR